MSGADGAPALGEGQFSDHSRFLSLSRSMCHLTMELTEETPGHSQLPAPPLRGRQRLVYLPTTAAPSNDPLLQIAYSRQQLIWTDICPIKPILVVI